MSDKTPTLLSEERLAEISAQLDAPRAHNSYVTDYGVAADVVEELLDHIDAQKAAVAEQLRGLLDEGFHEPENDFKRGINSERKQNNKLIYAAACALHIDL